MRIDVAKYLEDLTGRFAAPYTEALSSMLVAIAMQNRPASADAFDRLVKVQTETMGIGEVLGATMTLQRAARLVDSAEIAEAFMRGEPCDLRGMMTFAGSSAQVVLPRVTLKEAVQDMIDRTPVTIRRAAERTAQRIAQLYDEGRVVAFARSAEAAVTKRVQALIVQAMREGLGEGEAGMRLTMGVEEVRKRTAAWTESYARMAFRTNLNTAVTAGRFRQAQDQDVRAVVPCFRFDAVGDGDTRDNHRAADGLIFKVDNPIWNKIAPPLGYSCRCSLSYVTLPELRRMGRVGRDGAVREDRLPASARPDAGFRHGGRPDLFMVGA